MYNDELPDYYLGCLIYFDELGTDNCRWVVYDGFNRVRCPTRKSAIDYICSNRMNRNEELTRLLFSARLHINHAHDDLERAARLAAGPSQLLYENLSVKLRPFLVELDNQILI